jgi:hypothetical protein
MRELSLYSTQSLSQAILLVFAPFVSILSKLPKIAIKSIKPSGYPAVGRAFGSSQSLFG